MFPVGNTDDGGNRQIKKSYALVMAGVDRT